jgi:hypothetical protein
VSIIPEGERSEKVREVRGAAFGICDFNIWNLPLGFWNLGFDFLGFVTGREFWNLEFLCLGFCFSMSLWVWVLWAWVSLRWWAWV